MEKKFLTDLGVAEDIADKIITQAAAEAKTAADQT